MTASPPQDGLACMPRELRILYSAALLVFVASILIATGRASQSFAGWLKDHQTLVTGLFAVVAAFWTIERMNAGMKQATDLERKRRDHELNGARAVLPIALSAITGYAQRSADLLKTILDESTAFAHDVNIPADFKAPELSDEAVPVLRDVIRYGGPAESTLIADLLSHYQVQNVRLRSIPDDSRRGRLSKHNVLQYVFDAAELYMRASDLFNFARRRAEIGPVPPVDAASIRSGLTLCGFHHGEYPELDELFDLRWPGAPPGEDADV